MTRRSVTVLGLALLFAAIAIWSTFAELPNAGAPVAAQIEGAPQATTRVASEPVPAAAPEREAVPPGATLRITVRDAATRAPIADAAILAFDVEHFRARLDERQRQGLPTDTAARDALRAERAATARTDAAGVASVVRVGATCCIEATAAGGRWGRHILSGTIEGDVEILLAVDRTLRVHVTDGAGASLADVPVRLVRRRDGSRRTEASTQAGSGIATLEHAQLVLDGNDDAGVGFALPLLAPPFVAVAGEALPTEPIELVLPPAGSLRVVIVDEQDRPVRDHQVDLHVAAFASPDRRDPLATDGRWAGPRLDSDAVARVPWLGVGLQLRITATPRDPDSRHKPVVLDAAGPQRAGETVDCMLRWRVAADASYPLVAGRFVRDDGSPWPAGEVTAFVHLFPLPPVPPKLLAIAVAADGRFQFVAKDECPPGGSRVYQLTAREPRQLAGIEARLDLSRELPPGRTDVGDVVLAPGALLASGTVVDSRGAPIAGAALDVRQRVAERDGELWPSIECTGRWAAADGTFALYALRGAALPTAPLRLHAQHVDFAEHERDLALGATGLRIVLERHGSLAGSVLLGPGQRASDIAVLVRRSDRGIAVPKLADDGSFTVERLAPGPVTVVISLRTGVDAERRASRREICDVVVGSGETTRDPRLQAVSIAGTAISLRLRVTDRAGAPIAHASLQAATGFDVLTDADGVADLRPPRLPTPVRVTAFGYRDVELVNVAADTTVALEPALRVRLTTDARPQGHDPDYRLGFFLYHVDAAGNRGSPVYGRSFPHERKFFDTSGVAELPLPAAGNYDVVPYLFVSRKDHVGTGGTLAVQPMPRISVQEMAGEQTFAIAIPQHAIDTAAQQWNR